MCQMLGVFAGSSAPSSASAFAPALRGQGLRESGSAGRPIAAELEKAIRAVLDKPGRTEGVRKIAEQVWRRVPGTEEAHAQSTVFLCLSGYA
jgi:hypothetical protein